MASRRPELPELAAEAVLVAALTEQRCAALLDCVAGGGTVGVGSDGRLRLNTPETTVARPLNG